MRVILLFLFFAASTFETPAQQALELNKEPARRNQRVNSKDRLTLEKLQKALLITYTFGSGSVAPDYQYTCNVKVYKYRVDINFVGGKCVSAYKKNISITPTQFKSFLSALCEQNIYNVQRTTPAPCGARVSALKVSNLTQTLFEGSEYENLRIESGRLEDAFFNLLTDEIRNILKHPEERAVF